MNDGNRDAVCKRAWQAGWVLLVGFCLVGCGTESRGPGAAGDSQSTIRAIATVGMVADLVREVGGERVNVIQLMGAGVDPHLYKATRDDVQQIMSADLVFYCGLMLEGKMVDTLVKVGRQKPVFAVTELIDPGFLLEPEGMGGHADPHVWMDVAAWSSCVDVVVGALAEYDPEGAEGYRARGAEFQKRLTELHEYGRQVIDSIPGDDPILITSHDAFHYFGRAYGLNVQGVQGLSTESEAGLQRINQLVDLIVANQIRAVFVESSVSRKNIDALIEGAATRGHSVAIGGELYSDAMGPTGTWEGTYPGMLDHNFTVVARGLGGNAPEGGWLGKLKTVDGPQP